MAYNKTRFLENAQKYLNQGRISQAIVEYQQILRHEPKDQITLMTVGDLYVRQGETFQALEYFERLAQLFLNEGFVTKAIAIYKKITKLAPEESKPLERLAELYVQQGVLSEARPLYLQLAETHLRGGRQEQAVGLLRRLLEAEPDNLRVQTRLAELYNAIEQPKAAVETYLTAAQHLLERGEAGEAEKYADRALKIQPEHTGALAVKARALASAGRQVDAIHVLESLGDLDAAPEPAALLVELYLQTGASAKAAALARRTVKRDPRKYELVCKVASALVDSGELEGALELLNLIREAMTEAADHDRLAQMLSSAAARLPGRLEPLEWLTELYDRTGDNYRLADAQGQLAEAAANAGQLERAKKIYEQLLERSPEDESTRRRLNQVRARLGLEPVEEPIIEPQGVVASPALTEALPKPAAEPELDEDTKRYLVQALTDVDLFSSYGLTQKAIGLLETVSERVPRHIATLEKLLDLYLGAGNDRRTAELAAQLEQICHERGDLKNGERFGELRRRFQRAAGLAPEELAAAAQPPPPEEFPLPVVEATPVEEPPPTVEAQAVPEGEPAVHEVDLSEEWEALAQQLETAVREVPPTAEPVATPEETPPAEVVTEEEATAEYELELEPEEAAGEPAPTTSAQEFLSELATDFETFTPAPETPPDADVPPPAAPAAAAPAEPVGPLHEVFNEFRAELGEMAEEEDPETHYNLGIAYREMGLLEEAIGEFQKVAQMVQNGRPFRYAMQCCTLLGLTFMEKGQPDIAAMWYERALAIPGLDQETILALRYDLGVAQEQAGDPEAAWKSFSQVYAMNIDYRDVAERLAALAKRH